VDERPRIVLNEGLWCGTPDINGIDKLHHAHLERATPIDDPDRTLVYPDRIMGVPEGGRLPLSIMNVQLLAECIPAFWQPPDFALAGGWRIRRHDDVWATLVLSRVLRGGSAILTCGAPLIWHRKAGHALAETLSEHPTNLAQRYLEEALWAGPDGDILTIAEGLVRTRAVRGNQFQRVLQQYGYGLLGWATLFTRWPFGALA
jgi:hypothetical protein